MRSLHALGVALSVLVTVGCGAAAALWEGPAGATGVPAVGARAALIVIAVLAAAWGAANVIVAQRNAGVLRMNGHIRRFASGDLRHRIGLPDSEPWRAMAESLNAMAANAGMRIVHLRGQSNEQEGILRSMEGGVLAVDAEQRILRINRIARRMLDVIEPDVRGRTLNDVVRDPGLRAFVADAIADPGRRSREFRLGPAGEVTVRATSGSLLDSEDEPVGTIVLLSDVTQLKRLEAVRSEFAANVSHELRTPITSIKGYAETLLEVEDDGGERGREFLRVIARNAERLGAIVDDMLTLTNLERTGGQELPTSPTPAETLVENVRAQAAAGAKGAAITIVADAAPGLRVQANARLAEQALLNLVTNAIKYSPDGTTVTVRARPATLARGDAAVEFAVEDEGPGIAAEHLPRVFERFYRVDKARSRDRGGTGLGLSIVKHIALVHGGEVSVDSEIGRGSVFRLVLRASDASARSATGARAGSPANIGG